jgi:hypothetical protein
MFEPSDWPLISLLALPLGVAGLMLRARGRRGVERALASGTARRRLRDVQPGVVTVEGTWRVLDGGRGMIEDDGAAAVVDRGAGAPAIADGARVLCHGVARGEVSDPRGGGYRGPGRVAVIDATAAGDFVTTEVDAFERARAESRRRAVMGAMLVMLAVAAVVVGVALQLQMRE